MDIHRLRSSQSTLQTCSHGDENYSTLMSYQFSLKTSKQIHLPRGMVVSRHLVTVCLPSRFDTYFAHVDNVYSHRSTQKYKNRPFVSHYWDCRLKGRPAGTPKSTDPSKKKRKRVARERDLCDVKIKITEYLPGATREDVLQHLSQQPQQEGLQKVNRLFTSHQSRGALSNSRTQWSTEPPPILLSADGTIGTSFYTIQRVNGSGTTGNGGDGVDEEGDGRHKHTLEESDRVKKNSVMRHLVKDEKERRKSAVQVRSFSVILPYCLRMRPWKWIGLLVLCMSTSHCGASTFRHSTQTLHHAFSSYVYIFTLHFLSI